MSYQVIARKWRPQNFSDLVGQNHVSQTLLNALKQNRLPHALVFTGPRGTGKTSSARILAKSLRCENPVDFVPCNTCSSCLDINSSRSIDVIEIDGASNNGVDSIRELRDTVSYLPSSGSYKVYIIDEVHMLSSSAFNALLKTLEEPPSHVVFILATTELQKIPQTILSRCQRFDFRLISTSLIRSRLQDICAQDQHRFEDEALWSIAKQARGSMRDSQSLLDQVINFSGGAVTQKNVIDILGLTDQFLLIEALTFATQKNLSEMVECLKRIRASGLDSIRFCEDLIESVRNLILVASVPKNVRLDIDVPDSVYASYQELAGLVQLQDLHLIFDMLLKGAQDMNFSSSPELVFEVVLLRIASFPHIEDLHKANPQTLNPVFAKPAQPAVAPAPVKAQSPTDKWVSFVKNLTQQDAMLGAKLENLQFLDSANNEIKLHIPAKYEFLKAQIEQENNLKKLKASIELHWGPDRKSVV